MRPGHTAYRVRQERALTRLLITVEPHRKVWVESAWLLGRTRELETLRRKLGHV